MKTNNIDDQEEARSSWQEQRRDSFGHVDITSAVMMRIQPVAVVTKESSFQSSLWLELPSMFAGVLRTSIALFTILLPV